MSNEEKIVIESKDEKCFCKSKGFRKFLTIALGTFVGVYCALSLFTALHKPPMMPMRYMGFRPAPCPCMYHHSKFVKEMNDEMKDFRKEMKMQHKGSVPFVPNRVQEND